MSSHSRSLALYDQTPAVVLSTAVILKNPYDPQAMPTVRVTNTIERVVYLVGILSLVMASITPHHSRVSQRRNLLFVLAIFDGDLCFAWVKYIGIVHRYQLVVYLAIVSLCGLSVAYMCQAKATSFLGSDVGRKMVICAVLVWTLGTVLETCIQWEALELKGPLWGLAAFQFALVVGIVGCETTERAQSSAALVMSHLRRPLK